MSSIQEEVYITEPVMVAEPRTKYVEDYGKFAYGNAALGFYIVIFLIVFLLAIIIGTNPLAKYYTLQKPSWSPSLSTWVFIFALVLFFTAFASSKMQLGSRHKNHWYGLFYFVSIFLLLLFVFLIFQMDNFRGAFWVLVASAILLLITMFLGWNSYRASSLWLLPLLALEIVLMIETWQIINLNNL
jgi:tryptophan-rich sensory protein